jgi:hypothetical protein
MKTKNLALMSASAATLGLLFGPAAVQASALRPEIKPLATSGSPTKPTQYIQSNNNRGGGNVKSGDGHDESLASTGKPEMLAALAEALG